VSLKKILGWAVVVFIAYYMFTSPTGAPGAMQGLFHWLADTGHSLAYFLTSL
jgi:hypothetical protein